jgi:MerR family transcriptional regulator, copper efflux regulator
LSKYKLSLEDEVPELMDELSGYYYPKKGENTAKSQNGLCGVNNIRYDNPYEAYLTAQIQVSNALIPILDQHISLLKDDEDLDLVLESLELSIYRVKKQAYADVEDWEMLLYHLPEERLDIIEENPKGYGDLLLKELNWIRKYEDRCGKNHDVSKNEGEK